MHEVDDLKVGLDVAFNADRPELTFVVDALEKFGPKYLLSSGGRGLGKEYFGLMRLPIVGEVKALLDIDFCRFARVQAGFPASSQTGARSPFPNPRQRG